MGRFFALTGSLMALWFGLVILSSATPGHATTITYHLEATPYPAFSSLVSEFSLNWQEDTSGDGLFQLGELVPDSFRGVTHFPGTGIEARYTVIVAIPHQSSTSPYTGGDVSQEDWYFGYPGSNDWGVTPGAWSYSRSVIPDSVVPLPPSAYLLGAGLIWLAVARRRKQGGK